MASRRSNEQDGGPGWRELPANIEQQLLQKRREIDEIDRLVIELLARRFRATTAVGEIKRTHSLPVLDANREKNLLASRREAADASGVDPEFCEQLFLDILSESRRRQEVQLDEQR